MSTSTASEPLEDFTERDDVAARNARASLDRALTTVHALRDALCAEVIAENQRLREQQAQRQQVLGVDQRLLHGALGAVHISVQLLQHLLDLAGQPQRDFAVHGNSVGAS